jgi:hypothetical protein
MIAAAGLDLLMVFIHRRDLTSVGPSLWLYCFHLALFGLVGLLMYWLQRKVVPRSSSVDYSMHHK